MQLAAFTSDHFPMGQAAMQVNEGLPAYIVSALERRYGGLQGKTVGILGMAFKAESDDTRASLVYKLRKLLSWAGARVLCTDPYVDDDRLVPLDGVLAESDILVLGAPHKAYRGLQVGGKDVVDVWGALGRGDPALVRILVTGAAGFINGYLVPELLEAGHDVIGARRLQQVRPARRSRTTTIRATGSSRATPRTSALLTELAADCDQVVAAAAMIGGISYFHEFAYDLLAENERILASTFDAAIAAHKRRPPRADRRRELVDGLRVGDGLPDARGRPADLAAADLDVRLPEARVGVLRQGRLGAVPAAVHDRPAVQLRRHRRAPGACATPTS